MKILATIKLISLLSGALLSTASIANVNSSASDSSIKADLEYKILTDSSKSLTSAGTRHIGHMKSVFVSFSPNRNASSAGVGTQGFFLALTNLAIAMSSNFFRPIFITSPAFSS